MQVPSIGLSPVVLAIVGLAFLLLLLEAFTIGYTFLRRVQERRQESIEQPIREQILEIVRTEQPPYDAFISGLSQREYTAATRETQALIGQTSGTTTTNLRTLGKELGMYETAVKKLNGSDRIDRLHGLTTLSLLRHPPSATDVRAQCLENAVLRGAGANALASAGTAQGYREALNVLYHESSNRLSVLGMETVDSIGRDKPGLLLDELTDKMADTSERELVQTLLVFAELEIDGEPVDGLPQWITTTLAAENPRVRAAAVASLRCFNPGIAQYTTVAVSNAIVDSAPSVRRAAAQTVDSWANNEMLLAELADQLATEPDERVRQSIVTTLLSHGHRPQRPLPTAAMESWSWRAALTDIQAREHT
jgi:hypothetical protein